MIDFTKFKHLNYLLILSILGVSQILLFSGCKETAKKISYDTTLSPKEPLSESKPTPKTLYSTANVLASQKRYQEATALLKHLIETEPQFFPAYNSLAQIQMQQGATNEAIETIQMGLRINPKDPVLLNNLGMCLLVRTEYKKALSAFTEASGLVPENTRYRANMATALAMMGHYEESQSLFEQILPKKDAAQNVNTLRNRNNPEAKTEK